MYKNWYNLLVSLLVCVNFALIQKSWLSVSQCFGLAKLQFTQRLNLMRKEWNLRKHVENVKLTFREKQDSICDSSSFLQSPSYPQTISVNHLPK